MMEWAIILCTGEMDIPILSLNGIRTPTAWRAHLISAVGGASSEGMELMKIPNAFPNPILQIEQDEITLSAHFIIPAMFKRKRLSLSILSFNHIHIWTNNIHYFEYSIYLLIK